MIWAKVGSRFFCFCFCFFCLFVCFLLTIYIFSIFDYKDYNQFDFSVDHLVIFLCTVITCVVGKGCLQWPMCSLDKILLTFALLHCVPQGKLACYSRYLLTTHFCNQIHYDERSIFCVCVCVSSRRCCRSVFILGWLCYWIICLGKEPGSFCHFCDWTQVQALIICCWTMSNLPWFMVLTFQVPMQYCSLLHQTLLSPPDTSKIEYCFCFDPVASSFLELLVIAFWSFPVAYWTPSDYNKLFNSRL